MEFFVSGRFLELELVQYRDLGRLLRRWLPRRLVLRAVVGQRVAGRVGWEPDLVLDTARLAGLRAPLPLCDGP